MYEKKVQAGVYAPIENKNHTKSYTRATGTGLPKPAKSSLNGDMGI